MLLCYTYLCTPLKYIGELTDAAIGGFEDVIVEGATFPKCLKQETVVNDYDAFYHTEIDTALINGTRTLWFAQGVGIVKIRYEHSNGIVTEGELIDYKIVEQSDEYFPLIPGTTWTYKWQDDFYKQPFIDTITVEPMKPIREAYPLKVEVKTESGEVLGSADTFEVTDDHLYLKLHRGASSNAMKELILSKTL